MKWLPQLSREGRGARHCRRGPASGRRRRRRGWSPLGQGHGRADAHRPHAPGADASHPCRPRTEHRRHPAARRTARPRGWTVPRSHCAQAVERTSQAGAPCHQDEVPPATAPGSWERSRSASARWSSAAPSPRSSRKEIGRHRPPSCSSGSRVDSCSWARSWRPSRPASRIACSLARRSPPWRRRARSRRRSGCLPISPRCRATWVEPGPRSVIAGDIPAGSWGRSASPRTSPEPS